MIDSAVKTAVIGASGYVGQHLLEAYRTKFPDCFGTSFAAGDPSLRHLDIREPKLDLLKLEQTGHRAILIAAAKPNVAYCEAHPDESYAVNVRGTLALIDQIAQTSMQVVFISSDYVFDGVAGSYTDDAPTNPITEYGRQKAEVERELPNRSDNWLVLRLSKIFGLEKGDGTLLDDLAQSLAAGRSVRVATDQRFSPTFITDLVAACLAIQSRGLRGIVNLCSSEASSRYGLAKKLAETMAIDTELVEPVLLHDLPGMDGRPLNTSMIPVRLGTEVGTKFTPLSDSIRRAADNWTAHV